MVRNLLSGLSPGRRRAEAGAERERLLDLAYGLHMRAQPPTAVAAALSEAGARPADIDAISAEASARAEQAILERVSLPSSARLGFNYYFLLGVTPRASVDRIRRAYRRKAREVHPDIHAGDLTPGQWNRFMAVLTDAEQVLSDPVRRRAYDIFWRTRSREVAAQHRRPGERRGDWETRYLWEIAEMAEQEDRLVVLVQALAAASPGSADHTNALQALRQAVVRYESEVLELRSQTRALPDHLSDFSERARAEMHRKERLAQGLGELLPAARAAGAEQVRAAANRVLETLEQTRQAQLNFDLLHARHHL